MPLYCACINPNGAILEKFLEICPEYTTPDETLRKPVHYAAACSGVGPLEVLAKFGVDMREGDQLGMTPLMIAASCGRAKNVRFLLEKEERSNVNAKTKEGMMAIHFATVKGHVDCIKELLKKGALVNAPGRARMTPLIMAAAHGHYECVKYLHENKGRILGKDKLKRNALTLAAKNGNAKILSYLLANGGDFNQPDSSGNYPIHYAAAYGWTDCIDLLIKAGSDQNLNNSMNLTSLTVAMLKNRVDCVKNLIARPTTDVNCKDDRGRTLVSCTLENLNEEAIENIEFLLKEKNADVNIPDREGWTPLHYACQKTRPTTYSSGYGGTVDYNRLQNAINRKQTEANNDKTIQLILRLIRLLLEYKANINPKNNQGETPLQIAIKCRNYEVIDLLLDDNKISLLEVDINDSGIYHHLAPLITKDQGIKLFEKIYKAVGNEKDLHKLVNSEGFTPLLLYVREFVSQADGVYSELHSKAIDDFLVLHADRLQKEHQAHHNNLYGGGFGFGYGYHYGGYEILKIQETNEIAATAQRDFQAFIDKFIEILNSLTAIGANLGEQVKKLKHFRGLQIENEMDIEEEEKKDGNDESLNNTNVLGRNNEEEEDEEEEDEDEEEEDEDEEEEDEDDGYRRRRRGRYKAPKRHYGGRKKRYGGGGGLFGGAGGYGGGGLLGGGYGGGLLGGGYDYGGMPAAKPVRTRDADHYGPFGKQNALHLIIKYPHLKLLNLLLKSPKVDVNHQDINKNTALSLLISTGSRHHQHYNRNNTLEALLAAKADPNLGGSILPIYGAITSSDFDLARILLRHGANINTINNSSDTPLIYWVKQNHIQNVKTLIDMGADVKLADYFGATPLHHAVVRSSSNTDTSFAMERLLLDKGAEVNARDNNQRTPLHFAFVGQFETFNRPKNKDPVETVTSLLGIPGCDHKAKDKWEETPLHYAAQNGATICTIYLLNKGAEKDAKNIDGNTPLALAVKANLSSNCTAITLIQQDADVISMIHSCKRENPHAADTKFSMFTAALRNGWQGVSYLLIQKGYPLMNAIQDAINQNQFKYVVTLLSKVSDHEQIRKANEEGQNLFHSFAQRGSSSSAELTVEIVDELLRYKIDVKAADNHGKTPLHYAAQNKFYYLMRKLVDNGCNPNALDNSHHSAFSIHVTKYGLLIQDIETYKGLGSDLKIKFPAEIKGRTMNVTAFMYLLATGKRSMEVFERLINEGLDVNETDDDGQTSLVYAIKENANKLFRFLLASKGTNVKQKDKYGKTPIHYVVNPLPYGSYENTKMLDALVLAGFNVNEPDNEGRPPIYYAYLQDSGRMVDKLKELGGQGARPMVKRQATSVISEYEWPKEEVDYETDADAFLEKAQEREKMITEDEKEQPDPNAGLSDNFEVVYDEKLGPYSLTMTKVDVKVGGYGEYLFYVMQVLHEKNRDVYILFTRWGRIGETGAFQQTPYGKKEECIAEFCKIFSDKSGNRWEDKADFKKVTKKYQLLRFERKIKHTDYLKPFDLEDPTMPASGLEKETRTIMKGITSVKMYQRAFNEYEIDTKFLPLASLTKPLLIEAKQVLSEIADLLDELEGAKNVAAAVLDLGEMQRIREALSDKTSRFYELLPNSRFRSAAITPITNRNELKVKIEMLQNLLDIEISFKVILGAYNRIHELNPLDYCYSALNIKLMPLPKDHPEYQIIRQYVQNGYDGYFEGFIVNIFALERKGETQRMKQWSNLNNNMLLWHGSRASNFMGILNQGLRIAPPEAPTTGYMFGKGVYFADVFQKSYGYCGDTAYDDETKKNFNLLLLCEVALGEMYELTQAQYITELPPPYKSTKGLGSEGPNFKQSVVLANGAKVPCGRRKRYKYNNLTQYRSLGYNEYIVYDTTQIKMRYLVQTTANRGGFW